MIVPDGLVVRPRIFNTDVADRPRAAYQRHEDDRRQSAGTAEHGRVTSARWSRHRKYGRLSIFARFFGGLPLCFVTFVQAVLVLLIFSGLHGLLLLRRRLYVVRRLPWA